MFTRGALASAQATMKRQANNFKVYVRSSEHRPSGGSGWSVEPSVATTRTLAERLTTLPVFFRHEDQHKTHAENFEVVLNTVYFL